MVSQKELQYEVSKDPDLTKVLARISEFKLKAPRRTSLEITEVSIAGGALADIVLNRKGTADIDVFIEAGNVNRFRQNWPAQEEQLKRVGAAFFGPGNFSVMPFHNEFYTNFRVIEGTVTDVERPVQVIIPLTETRFDLFCCDFWITDKLKTAGAGFDIFAVAPLSKSSPKTFIRMCKYIDRGVPTWDMLPKYFLNEIFKRTRYGGEELQHWKNEGFSKLLGLSLPYLDDAMTDESKDWFWNGIDPVDIVRAKEAYKDWNPKVNWTHIPKHIMVPATGFSFGYEMELLYDKKIGDTSGQFTI